MSRPRPISRPRTRRRYYADGLRRVADCIMQSPYPWWQIDKTAIQVFDRYFSDLPSVTFLLKPDDATALKALIRLLPEQANDRISILAAALYAMADRYDPPAVKSAGTPGDTNEPK